ncbi:phosphoglycerate mutase family protein [Wenzhouxiangella sp. AB-CW3]|uniref:histidine phosphatase family protein n=1 Tax=Wenzhouxiangella sp. AB-CW3 TaxID=2771012 RepID=UPI00168ADBC1|nr:histidine phosphatase family protein [Wenzhouxiangella sp. AB-CW3]QOC23852.1 phosphoglycerate mutase family protein [Wenzhouxiangella sp. AB-CW3]
MSPVVPSLILVRHGQASLGEQDYDRLSPLGQRQAMLTGQRLASILESRPPLWSGTHRRHRQTVDGLPVAGSARVLPALDEFSTYRLVRVAIERADRLGIRRPANTLLADPQTHLPRLLEWFPEVLDAWQSGDFEDDALDPWPVFRERVLSPVDDWQQELMAGRSVVVVSSAGVISTLVAELTGRGLGFQRQLAVSMYNASVSQLYPGVGNWQADVINCTDHLAADDLVTLA